MGRPHDDPRLHDMGGNIGPADISEQPEEGRGADQEGAPAVSPSAESLAVDSLPDDARTGTTHQDETTAVQESGGEIRHLDDLAGDSGGRRGDETSGGA